MMHVEQKAVSQKQLSAIAQNYERVTHYAIPRDLLHYFHVQKYSTDFEALKQNLYY